MRVAIMQPYFMPYAGYFRLMAAADLFVFYDCVQFPRRGWVHRNKLTLASGRAEWLTLPLAKSSRDDTRIIDLHFAENAQAEWERRLSRFPALAKDSPLMDEVRLLKDAPCDYLIRTLRAACAMLNFTCRFARSSELTLPDALKGQDRILAIAKHFAADAYVNAPGGRELYRAEAFAAQGIALSFLPDYRGSFTGMLERLQTESADKIAREIRENL